MRRNELTEYSLVLSACKNEKHAKHAGLLIIFAREYDIVTDDLYATIPHKYFLNIDACSLMIGNISCSLHRPMSSITFTAGK